MKTRSIPGRSRAPTKGYRPTFLGIGHLATLEPWHPPGAPKYDEIEYAGLPVNCRYERCDTTVLIIIIVAAKPRSIPRVVV